MNQRTWKHSRVKTWVTWNIQSTLVMRVRWLLSLCVIFKQAWMLVEEVQNHCKQWIRLFETITEVWWEDWSKVFWDMSTECTPCRGYSCITMQQASECWTEFRSIYAGDEGIHLISWRQDNHQVCSGNELFINTHFKCRETRESTKAKLDFYTFSSSV